MTLPRFGKILPIQGEVLRLAGNVLSLRNDVVPRSDDERIDIMRLGRASLVKRTGVDFGYDLRKWVEYLETSENHRSGFTHPYGYRSTLDWVHQAIDDPDRVRLVEKLNLSEKPSSG